MMEACASYPVATDRHAQELAVLGSISRLLASRGGQQEMLSAVLEELERKLGMIRGTVMLLLAGRQRADRRGRPQPPLRPAPRSPLSPRRGDHRHGRADGPAGHRSPRVEGAALHQPHPPAADGRRRGRQLPLRADRAGEAKSSARSPSICPSQEPEILQEQSRLLEIVASMIAFDVKSRRMEALHRQQTLEAENLRLRDALEERFRPENIIGNSHAMREVYVQIHQVAASDTTVLIRGESGTGKELVASAIHYGSPPGAAAASSR